MAALGMIAAKSTATVTVTVMTVAPVKTVLINSAVVSAATKDYRVEKNSAQRRTQVEK